MPWRARSKVGVPLIALALVATVVVSCVSVTTQAVSPATPTAASGTVSASPSEAARPLEASIAAFPTAGPAAAQEPEHDATEGPERHPTEEPQPTAAAERRPTPDPGVEPAVAAEPVATSTTTSTAEPEVTSTAELEAPSKPSSALDPSTDPSSAAISQGSEAETDASDPPTPNASEGADPSAPAPQPSPAAEPTLEVAPSPAFTLAPVPSELPVEVAPSTEIATQERETPALDRATIRKIKRVLARTTGKQGVAGLQVAIRLADGRTWVGTSGNAEYVPERPVEDDTVFAIASVTKTFIAALILQLAEEGKLQLDGPYGRYIREGPRRGKVTIRQLLSHTSGIYDYFSSPRYLRSSTAWLRARPQPGLLAREHAWTFDDIMGLVRPVRYCGPGECYRYSNTNYILLGRVAEAVGEAPLHRLLRRRFFRKLGLDDTYYQPAEQPPDTAAHGHWPAGTGYTDHTRDDPLRPFTAAVTVAGAAGAIASTARDLSVWAQALYGGRILSPASRAQMMAIRPDGSYGLGTDYAVFAGHPAYGHRGGLRGFEASMWYFPDAGVSIVILSNQGNWYTSRARSIDTPMQGIAKAVLGKRR